MFRLTQIISMSLEETIYVLSFKTSWQPWCTFILSHSQLSMVLERERPTIVKLGDAQIVGGSLN